MPCPACPACRACPISRLLSRQQTKRERESRCGQESVRALLSSSRLRLMRTAEPGSAEKRPNWPAVSGQHQPQSPDVTPRSALSLLPPVLSYETCPVIAKMIANMPASSLALRLRHTSKDLYFSSPRPMCVCVCTPNMTQKQTAQATKLPSYQAATKLPSYQATKLRSYQATKLPS